MISSLINVFCVLTVIECIIELNSVEFFMLHFLLFIITYLSGLVLTFRLSAAFIFVLYEAIYFFFPSNRWWGHLVPDISYSFYTVILMIIITIINFKKTAHNKIFAAPQFKWMYLLLLTFGVVSFFAVRPIIHEQFFKNYLVLIIIVSMAYKLVDTDKKLDFAMWGYIFGSWYLSFYIFQMGRNSGDRVEAIGVVDAVTSNAVAAAIAPSIVLCLYYYWSSSKLPLKLIFAVAGIFIANAIVLINSRGAFLAVSCSIMYYIFFMYFSSMQKKMQKATVVWLAVAGLSGVVYIADDSFIDRMGTISQSTEVNEEQESGATRTVFWNAAWEMAKDFPLGTGTNGFEHYAPIYIPQDVHTGRSRNRAVHSSWFEVLSELGYLGLFFLIMLFVSSFKATKKCKKLLKTKNNINQYFKVIAIESALISFMVSMLFINRFKAEILYWLILYSACAYNIYVLNKDYSGSEPEKEGK